MHGAPRLAARTTEAAFCLDRCAVLTRTAWVHILLTPDARAEASTSILIQFGSLPRNSNFWLQIDNSSYLRWVISLCSVNRSNLRSRASTRRREAIRGSAALWLFNSRPQAHLLLEQHKTVLLMPNVRAKRAATAWRAGQQAQNGPQAQRLMAGATCRWRSA